MAEDTRPGLTGIHHFSATVTDVEASAAWYQRLFGLARLPVTFPHYEREDTGYAVLLLDQRSGVVIGAARQPGQRAGVVRRVPHRAGPRAHLECSVIISRTRAGR
jgi:catechol 2,3-dioxygenase-like lactoylglutathione lyase family enzyme